MYYKTEGVQYSTNTMHVCICKLAYKATPSGVSGNPPAEANTVHSELTDIEQDGQATAA